MTSTPNKSALPGQGKKSDYSGAKRGAKATEAEKETVYGTMSVDSAVWEFVQACETWKQENGRSFIPQSTLFQILLGLGYRKLGSVHKVCESCGGFFAPRENESPRIWRNRKFCNPKCAKTSDIDINDLIERGAIFKQCQGCGSIFVRKDETNGDWKQKIYCSRGCRSAAAAITPSENRTKVCKGCECSFSPNFMESSMGWTRRVYCTPECERIHVGHRVIPDDVRYKVCPKCESMFTPKAKETAAQWARRIYCSPACQSARLKAGKVKTCKHCECEFYPRPDESGSSWGRRKFCSEDCRKLAGVPSEERSKVCLNCKETFYFTGNCSPNQWSTRQFCSNSCASAYTHRKYDWTEEDMQLVRDSYPTLGSNIPALIAKRYPRTSLKAMAKSLGVKYIGSRNSPKTWRDDASKVCVGCAKVFYPHDRETPTRWSGRRYCSQKCGTIHSKRVIFTADEREKIRKEYPKLSKRLVIPGKSLNQIIREAHKMKVYVDRSSKSI